MKEGLCHLVNENENPTSFNFGRWSWSALRGRKIVSNTGVYWSVAKNYCHGLSPIKWKKAVMPLNTNSWWMRLFLTLTAIHRQVGSLKTAVDLSRMFFRLDVRWRAYEDRSRLDFSPFISLTFHHCDFVFHHLSVTFRSRLWILIISVQWVHIMSIVLELQFKIRC